MIYNTILYKCLLQIIHKNIKCKRVITYLIDNSLMIYKIRVYSFKMNLHFIFMFL